MSTRGQLAWLEGINSPRRPSASPKRKAKRANTPPAKRTSFVEHAEQQPFAVGGRTAPLTPLSWDVDAAREARTEHPSAKPIAHTSGGEESDNPNARARKTIKDAKRAWHNRKGGPGQKGKGRGRGGGGPGPKGEKGKGKANDQQKGAERQVFINSGKDAKGAGKRKAK